MKNIFFIFLLSLISLNGFGYSIEAYLTEAVQFLLERGADVDRCDEYGNSLLEKALYHKFYKTAALLAANMRGFDDNYNYLTNAAQYGAYEVVKILVESDNTDQQKIDLGIALYKAAENGYLNIVELLISKGANVNTLTSEGLTPVMLVLKAMKYSNNGQYHHFSILKALITGDTDLDFQTKDSITALDLALETKNEQVIELIRNSLKQ